MLGIGGASLTVPFMLISTAAWAMCICRALCIVVASMACAPLGARLAHRLPGDVLKRIFALLLLGVGLKMLLGQ